MRSNVIQFQRSICKKGKRPMDKLKMAREGARISVAEIARELGMAPAAYRRYERGEVFPKINVCAKICKIIGKSIGEVFDDDYEPPKDVDLSYRARPGQTLYIKIEVNGDSGLTISDQNIKKIA